MFADVVARGCWVRRQSAAEELSSRWWPGWADLLQHTRCSSLPPAAPGAAGGRDCALVWLRVLAAVPLCNGNFINLFILFLRGPLAHVKMVHGFKELLNIAHNMLPFF